MDRDALLLTIAEKGYDVAFGARKTFATYDWITKLPGWVGLASSAIGIAALIYEPLSTKWPSGALLVIGIATLYLSFYRAEEYYASANKLLSLLDRLKDLYRLVKGGSDPVAAKAEFDAINTEYRAISIGKQVFLSGWYAHYKLFAETQVGWMDEQLHFTWKDKWPLSARLFLATVALATLIGLTYWGYSAHFCV
ncbi:SLATT domain-containing protein [Sphingomonas hominis]|jgi:hypothetical protein|uniref:SLATT domain-containing protein n=1 Tax=Sphingomonas hominis TaxID=2741495 RepID=A0ABX2JM24_9SPHN|nr:SLATT domain-containing protein [Sphingomonas hominis]NTS66540.1 SLATT domain-containing protein [Sphingomonas hominis]HEX2019788.1 SLATT domain-containing protein [Aurantimonas sp.]